MCTINPLNSTLIPYPLYPTPYIYSLRTFVYIYQIYIYTPSGIKLNIKQNLVLLRRKREREEMTKRYLEGYYYKYELPRFISKKIRNIISEDTTAEPAATNNNDYSSISIHISVWICDPKI